MVIYEVNLTVDEDIAASYAGWLTEHVREMVTFKGFGSAQWFFRLDDEEELPVTDKKLWTIQYLIDNVDSLNDYLQNHAERVRRESAERFGDKFTAQRRILHLYSIAANIDEMTRQRAALDNKES